MFSNGYIFICNDVTEQECFSNCLFGAPRNGWEQVSKISDTTAIFLLKRCKKTAPIMYGVFLPNGRPELNIDPWAWGGKFPSQIRVKQYYKFCSAPMITFKKVLHGKKKFSRTGLPITLPDTLDLITKLIINTRFHLARLVSNILGDLAKRSWSKMLDEQLLIRFSMSWLKTLACKNRLEFRFFPEFMPQGGTINDFIHAIRSTEGGQDSREIILRLREDWQKFLELASKISRIVAVNMAKINSILLQRSLSIWPYIPGVPLENEQLYSVKEWVRKSWKIPSLARTGKPCTARKISVSEIH